MFVDKAKIYVKGGDGGDGLVAFRREKYVPDGGPAGGDGGKGGDVIFRVDEGLRTLMDFRYQRHFKADRGIKGRNKSQHGANAENMIVRIPPGTIVIDDDSGEVLADLTLHGQQIVVARLPANGDLKDPAAFNFEDADTYNRATSSTVYDSMGQSYKLTTYYLKDQTQPNTWQTYYTMSDENGEKPVNITGGDATNAQVIELKNRSSFSACPNLSARINCLCTTSMSLSKDVSAS